MKLLVIEGIDGAGKSTQIKLLREFFANKGKVCEYLHFPRTDSPFFGELIARFLRGEFGSNDQVDPYLVAMLYAGDRRDAAALLLQWLGEGKIVILDRYTYSNIAYQCAKLQEASDRLKLREWIFELEFSHFGIPKPDINIFLDVPFTFTEKKLMNIRSGADRSYLNGNRDIHEESMTFQQRVREIYLETSATDSTLAVIDCSSVSGAMLAPEEVFRKIVELLEMRNLI